MKITGSFTERVAQATHPIEVEISRDEWRYLFAGIAMQVFATFNARKSWCRDGEKPGVIIAESAVALADRLLDELEKKGK